MLKHVKGLLTVNMIELNNAIKKEEVKLEKLKRESKEVRSNLKHLHALKEEFGGDENETKKTK